MEIDLNQIKHLKVKKISSEYSVALIDAKGFEITKGYGLTVTDAINDMHHNLF